MIFFTAGTALSGNPVSECRWLCAQANKLFGAGKHTEALRAYLIALTYVDEDFMIQLEGVFLDQANAVKAPVLLNMAACQLHLGDFRTADRNCTDVLALCTSTPGPEGKALQSKALFRRGKARKELGQTDEALKDLATALLMCASTSH